MHNLVLSRRDSLIGLVGLVSLLGRHDGLAQDVGEHLGDVAMRNFALRGMRLVDTNPAWLTAANWDNRAYGPWTDYLAGRMSEADFSQACAKVTDYCLRDVWNLNKQKAAAIDWHSAAPFNWNGIHALALRFFRTGNEIYVGKWLGVVSDYAAWSLSSLKEGKEPISKGEPAALLESAMAWGGIFAALHVIAKGLAPRPAGEAPRQGSPFAAVVAEVDARSFELVPAPALLKIVSAFASGHAIQLARYYSDPKYVPNQRVFGFEALANLDVYFPTLPPVVVLRPAVHAGLKEVFSRYRLPDGGQLEQSFNYAQDVVFAAARVRKLPFGRAPEWLSQADETFIGWTRLATALATPRGGLPQVGNAAWGRFGRDVPPVAFAATSIAFPYSGFYVQRSEWSPDAAYLFFFNRRAARGHSMAGSNSVQIAAYGRPLLMAGGSADYRPLARSNTASSGYLTETSSWKTSTVLVDGRSQRGGGTEGLARDVAGRPDITIAPSTPIRARWLASDAFDYLEGLYGEGYQATISDPNASPVTDVKHLRQVVFVRSLKLWIVVDVLQTPASHQYTQIWKFAAPKAVDGSRGFALEQVALDEPARLIRTTDDATGAVNVALHHFGVEKIGYQRHFGTDFGWSSVGPLAEAVPAVDVHASWRGTGPQVLLTVIAPFRGMRSPINRATDASADGYAGCRLELGDGTRLAVAAAAKPAKLSASTRQLEQGDLLVVVEREGRPPVSLELAGSRGFEANDGRRTPVIVPEGFGWKVADGRLQPVYTLR